MAGFVDLHCHWLPGIDDGARTLDEGLTMLRGLSALGFEHVVATPHIRPAMFDNRKAALVEGFARARAALAAHGDLPAVSLASEHFYDEIVFAELVAERGLPYRQEGDGNERRVGGGLLIEFHDLPPAQLAERQIFELTSRGYVPVIAHPERYREVWRAPERLERLLDLGAAALLDVAALVGKYGSETRRSAEALLERGLFDAACSDAHRPLDVDDAGAGIERLVELEGAEEARILLSEAPRALLAGRLPD